MRKKSQNNNINELNNVAKLTSLSKIKRQVNEVAFITSLLVLINNLWQFLLDECFTLFPSHTDDSDPRESTDVPVRLIFNNRNWLQCLSCNVFSYLCEQPRHFNVKWKAFWLSNKHARLFSRIIMNNLANRKFPWLPWLSVLVLKTLIKHFDSV